MPDKAGTGERGTKPAREPWIIRTYAGFGDARQANRRVLSNLKEGQRGLSIAFDLPTQNGYDPDAPVAASEVGKAGVSICHWRDMETLFDGIPLGKINTSMTINATAPFIWRSISSSRRSSVCHGLNCAARLRTTCSRSSSRAARRFFISYFHIGLPP